MAEGHTKVPTSELDDVARLSSGEIDSRQVPIDLLFGIGPNVFPQ
jgi:hypothetical protein